MSRIVWLALVLAACTEPDHRPEIEGNTRVELHEIPLDSPDPIDVVFVIDDGVELAPFREKLVESYPRMMDVFGSTKDRPDLHVGVITTQGNGGFRASALVDGEFIEDVVHEDYTHVIDYRGTLAEAFTSIARIDGASSASPDPLLALARTLEAPNGFVRRGVPLYVVIVSARDDASPLEPADYAARVRGLVPDPNHAVIALLRSGATPRLDAFAARFERSFVVRLPDEDPADVMRLAPSFQWMDLGAACITPPIDFDLDQPGVQADCSAQLSHFGSLAGSILPICSDGAAPCWRSRPYPGCIAPSELVEVEFGEAPRPRGGVLSLQCVVGE